MPIKRTMQAICDLTGVKANCEPNDVAEDERDEDPQTPPGWAVITVRRVVPNPAYAEAEQARALWLAQQQAMIRPDTTAEQRAFVLAELEDQAPENDEPRFIVETAEGVICPSEVDRAMKRIGIESWE